MDEDDYAAFAGGKLKMKKTEGVESAGKKKKKKDKDHKKLQDQIPKIVETIDPEDISGMMTQTDDSSSRRQYTKAELAFKKQQEKMQTERITQKAMKTHKQRVEAFNRHLDNLTEHFDIPKVSWTK